MPTAEAISGAEQPVVLREVRFECSRDFPRILEHLNVALLVSTYQAGKLAVVGSQQGQLTLAFHNFERVMGVAVSPQRIAVGAGGRSTCCTRPAIWPATSSPRVPTMPAG